MWNVAARRTALRGQFVNTRTAAVEPLEVRRLLAAEISLTSELGPEITDGDTTPSLTDGTDYGDIPVATGRPLHNFVITNTSPTDTLTLSTLTVPAGFEVAKDLPASIGPGGIALFSIRLLDTAQQARTGTVQFTTNVPGQETFNFDVAGEVVAATPAGADIHEDVPSFSDSAAVSQSEGTDPDGLPVSSVANRLLRFNIPAGQANAQFTLDSTRTPSGATGDVQLVITKDADGDSALDLAELNAPVTTLTKSTPDGGAPADQTVVLDAGTYFAVLRVANFATDPPAPAVPTVDVNYALNATLAAVQPPAVAVTFNGTAVADDDVTPTAGEGTDFGAVQVGDAAVERTFTVTNAGGQPLTLGGVTTTGGYEVVTDLPDTLAPGGSTTFVVRLPSTAPIGAKNGTISFATNVPANNPYNFDVTGTVDPAGTPAPEIDITLDGGGGAVTDGQPTPVDFGTAGQGGAGNSRTFVITNPGAASLTVGAVTAPAGYTVSKAPDATVAAGASTTFTLTLDPSTTGTFAGMVSVANNDANENPFDFPVTGTVVTQVGDAPDITVLVDAGVGLVSGGASNVDFSVSIQGQAGASKDFVVRNDGAAVLTLGAVTVPTGFQVTQPLPSQLAPGSFATLTIATTTATGGPRSGTVSIASNDPDENPFTIAVSGLVASAGAVQAPEITVLVDGDSLASGASLDFGVSSPNAPQSRDLTIRNDGTVTLSIAQIVLPTGFTLTDPLDDTTLTPGQSSTIRVSVSSSMSGPVSGPMTIASNDADEDLFTLNLNGLAGGVGAPTGPVGISSVTGKFPPIIIAGTKKARGTVTVRLTNVSNASAFAGPVTIIAFASGDAVADGGDTTIGTITRNVKLKAAGSKTLKVKALFPANAATGTRTIVATAAFAGQQSDQAAGPQVNVQAPFVHLTGSTTPVPLAKPLVFGVPARLSIPLTNGGNVPTTKTPATYTLIVSTSADPVGQVFSTTALGKISLKPGATRPQKLSATFPAGSFPAGSYTLIVRLTAELNDANGQTVAVIPFSIA
jgi:hypothetical protein